MKEHRMTKLRVIAVAMALVAVVAFFLPFISATEEYGEYIDMFAENKLYDSADLTVGELKGMSLYKYARVYIQGGAEIFASAATGYFMGGTYAAVGVLALLTAVAAWREKPVLTFLLDIFMGVVCYIVHWDITDRGIMPDSRRVWGIAHGMYCPLVAIIGIVAIWMFVEKRRKKKMNRPCA